MKLLLSFVLLFSLPAFACEYTGLDGILVTKKDIKTEELPLKGCSPEEQEMFKNTLVNLEGNISAFQLNEILGFANFKLNQDRLIITSLNKMTRQQLALKDNIHVSARNNSPALISFQSHDHLSLFCNGCLYGENQTLTLHVKNILGETAQKLINVDFRTLFTAYRVLGATAAFAQIPSDNIEVVQTDSIPHTSFLEDPAHLKFYQTNKALKAGELIKMSDLSPSRIIKAGIRSELILENKFIKIKTHGIPRSSGVIGEFVEVYHPEKKKKYYGKVIDINKVHVDL